MCGILGIISQNKKNLETFANKSSLNSISHRGPDSQGYIKGKDYFLDSSKSFFIFMFNPFDSFVMKKFLTNNIDILRKNRSVIAYCNYIEIKTIKRFCKKIIYIKKYKLALIIF